MATKEETRRAAVSKNNNKIKLMASSQQRDFVKGELVEATMDYISDDWPMNTKALRKFGIILEPKSNMYGDAVSDYASKILWADNSEEVVWQFEVKGVVKKSKEKNEKQ